MTQTDPILDRPTAAVPYRGESLVVGPLELRQFGPFTREIRDILPSIMRLMAAIEGDDFDVLTAMVDMLAGHSEQMQHALAIAVDREPDFIGRGTAGEVMALGRAVFEVNRDFFVAKVAPMLRNLKQADSGSTEAAPSPSGDGPMSSTT